MMPRPTVLGGIEKNIRIGMIVPVQGGAALYNPLKNFCFSQRNVPEGGKIADMRRGHSGD